VYSLLAGLALYILIKIVLATIERLTPAKEDEKKDFTFAEVFIKGG